MRVPSAALALGCAFPILVLAMEPAFRSENDVPPRERGSLPAQGCLACHDGIEEMHPWQKISCVDCHGGNEDATEKEKAHVQPTKPAPNDERVAPLDYDLAYRRFANPADFRVVAETCGSCHSKAVSNMKKSLHGTTAGHLSDGYYENGVVAEKTTRFAIFPVVQDADGEKTQPGARSYARLPAIPAPSVKKAKDRFATHYSDLPRKACMQCHLYSRGRAVRGRLGMDGDYRSEGCSACHVTYSDDGLSQSRDASANRLEPGHPREHRLTTAVPTQSCTRCHYGDASIGLSFRGLAQLVPGQPAGPQVPGTTAQRLNGTYYLNDPKLVPPDLHHERGMHCIDCHTVRDVMGDGKIYGFMEDAVEIRCQSCHGSFEQRSDLQSAHGRKIENLRREGDRLFLVSKVDGKKHLVKQAKDVINPGHAHFNERAALAMNALHRKLECYACHAGWTPNFFGFHFDRNESFTQLDTISGERTPGRVTTQEKVFATFKNFYLGTRRGDEIAPYMVGFSTLGSATDEKGVATFVQKMPETSAGLSGMTMIHHQPHTTRPEGRSCIDCHRSSAVYGMGSGGFRLFRDLALVTSLTGLEIVAVNRKNIDDSIPLATLPLEGAGALALRVDPVQGQAERAFILLRPPSSESRERTSESGVLAVDLANPAFPRREDLLKSQDPQAILASGPYLYVADGAGGVLVAEASDKMRRLGGIATKNARALALSWPYLFVADGAAGLTVLDVANPASPQIVAADSLDLSEENQGSAEDISILWQPSRPRAARNDRIPARRIAAIACGKEGLRLVDVTNPEKPWTIPLGNAMTRFRERRQNLELSQVRLGSNYDLGSEGGELPTEENDYAYLLHNFREEDVAFSSISILRITDPERPRVVGYHRLGQQASSGFALAKVYNTPFLQTFALIGGARSIQFVDVTRPDQPAASGAIGVRLARAIALEEFPLDEMIDVAGRALKDISHPDSRYLSAEHIERLLKIPLDPDLFSGRRGPVTGGKADRRPK